MLRIRFQRTGKRNRPFFRIVVIEKSAPPRGGRPLEIVGFYDPLKKEKGVKAERVLYWLERGAQLSDPVYNLCVKLGIIKGKKKAVHAKKESSETDSGPDSQEENPAPEKETEETEEREENSQEKKE